MTLALPRQARHAIQPAHRRTPRGRWQLPASASFGALVGAALLLFVYRGLADDAYITLAIARNFAEDGTWAVTPGLVSNTATSPLQILVLAVGTLMVGGSPIGGLGVVLAGSLAATSAAVTALALRCGMAWWAGPLAAVLLASCPLMMATVGLESFLLVAILAGLVLAQHAGRTVTAGMMCGLVVLARPDAGVFALTAALAAVLAAPSLGVAVRRVGVMAGTAVGVVTPWLVASTLLFGVPVPDTLAWKTAQTQGLGGKLYDEAIPLFLDYFPGAATATVALVLVGVVALLGWMQVAPTHCAPVILGGGAVLHAAVMTTLGVPPFTWYYAPVVAAAALLTAVGAAALLPRRVGVPRLGLMVVVPVAAVLLGAVGYGVSHDRQAVPMHANGATAQQYAAIAASVPAGAVLETAHGEVGALAFFCKCTVVDPLSDPGRMAPVIEAQLARPGGRGAALRVLYRGWTPRPAVRADYRTRYLAPDEVHANAFPVWSGLGAWGRLAVEPVE